METMEYKSLASCYLLKLLCWFVRQSRSFNFIQISNQDKTKNYVN
jgi:hypothetical protein